MRLGRLVDGMFDISVLDLRSGPAHAEATELSSAIATAINAVAPFAAARKTDLALLAIAQYDVAIGADRLAQILINILENAIKHGREHGRVYVSVEPLDRYVEVRIDDDGPGVDRAERELIFMLARRGVNARAHGSGIGLAVVRLMLERIGGEVDVTESLLGGAQFRVRLPLMPAPAGSDLPSALSGLA